MILSMYYKGIGLFEAKSRQVLAKCSETPLDSPKRKFLLYFWIPENLHLYLAYLMAVSSTSRKCGERKIWRKMKQMVPSPKELFDSNGCSIENLRWVTLFCP